MSYRGFYQASFLKDHARQLRRDQTVTEKMMWKQLRNRRFMGLKFRRQHQFDFMILDFYCAELKLAIEIDGSIHSRSDIRIRDLAKDGSLNNAGIHLIRFDEKLVRSDICGALEVLRVKVDYLRS